MDDEHERANAFQKLKQLTSQDNGNQNYSDWNKTETHIKKVIPSNMGMVDR